MNEDSYVEMIDKLINNISKMKQFEIELYCTFIDEKFNLKDEDVYDVIFELSEKGFNAAQIYVKLSGKK